MNPIIRKQVLERDEYTCQLNKLFGIARLTGASCSEDLEVHHIRYGRDMPEDLITVCKRCHELLTDGIRKERYLKRCFKTVHDSRTKLPMPLGEKEYERIEIQTYRIDPIIDAQRAISQSDEQLCKGNQEN